ncbi:MAG: hypothetical protein LBJ11_07845 [Oscillospiraceae bacterium]|nr:hypothetical protein [Oscillospiraceae bacterium]
MKITTEKQAVLLRGKEGALRRLRQVCQPQFLAVLLLAALLVSLVPILVIGRYDVPSLDDYS